MSTTMTSESRIANTGPIAPDTLRPFGDDLGFSTGSMDLLVHSRRKRVIRSQDSILTAILDACRTPNVQHWIMVRARLGYDTFWHHMSNLISQGMMETMHEGNKTLYRINAKGINYLDRLETAEESGVLI